MKGRLILHGALAGRPAAALMIDGRLEDALIAPPDDVPPPEAVYRAKIGRPVKGLGGVFVELPGGRGFLRAGRQVPPAGQSRLVQIAAHAEPGKAPPVTDRLRLKGRLAIATPAAPGANLSRGIRGHEARARLSALAEAEIQALPEGCGLILRTAAAAATDDEIIGELAALRARLSALTAAGNGPPAQVVDAPGPAGMARREWWTPDAAESSGDAFDAHGVADALAALAGPVPLPAGATMSVEPTRALIAVDVNTGADVTPAAGLKANLAAADALPRHLRLTGLGGQIVIDPAPMPAPRRERMAEALKAAFRADPVDTQALSWTALGHFELRRKRVRWPLPLAEIAAE